MCPGVLAEEREREPGQQVRGGADREGVGVGADQGDEAAEQELLLSAAGVKAFVRGEITVFRQRGRAAVAVDPEPARDDQQKQKQPAEEPERR